MSVSCRVDTFWNKKKSTCIMSVNGDLWFPQQSFRTGNFLLYFTLSFWLMWNTTGGDFKLKPKLVALLKPFWCGMKTNLEDLFSSHLYYKCWGGVGLQCMWHLGAIRGLQLTFSSEMRVKGLISAKFGSASLLIYLDLWYYIPEVKTVKSG